MTTFGELTNEMLFSVQMGLRWFIRTLRWAVLFSILVWVFWALGQGKYPKVLVGVLLALECTFEFLPLLVRETLAPASSVLQPDGGINRYNTVRVFMMGGAAATVIYAGLVFGVTFYFQGYQCGQNNSWAINTGCDQWESGQKLLARWLAGLLFSQAAICFVSVSYETFLFVAGQGVDMLVSIETMSEHELERLQEDQRGNFDGLLRCTGQALVFGAAFTMYSIAFRTLPEASNDFVYFMLATVLIIVITSFLLDSILRELTRESREEYATTGAFNAVLIIYSIFSIVLLIVGFEGAFLVYEASRCDRAAPDHKDPFFPHVIGLIKLRCYPEEFTHYSHLYIPGTLFLTLFVAKLPLFIIATFKAVLAVVSMMQSVRATQLATQHKMEEAYEEELEEGGREEEGGEVPHAGPGGRVSQGVPVHRGAAAQRRGGRRRPKRTAPLP